ncbi:MAG: CDP-diacylglycerol--serine O-phosphatidyltransferase [Methanothrix sp.]|nr:CDP-diacylglycerol--serine O-phosphatidyltransferase [Methanothrix sp.]
MNVLKALRAPDYFTLLNAAFGLCALLAAGQAPDHNSTLLAVIFIIFAAIADGLDGFLARRLGSSQIGANLDSLADLVSFGVAPAFLALKAFDSPNFWPAGIFYLLCGALRLARFNVDSKSDQFFEGLPIPAAGIALSGCVLLGSQIITLIFMLLLAMLMVSSVSYPKMRDQKSAAFLVLAFLAAGILVWLQKDITYSSHLLIAIIIVYLMSPVVISCLQKGR